jgi:hypothetical protein
MTQKRSSSSSTLRNNEELGPGICPKSPKFTRIKNLSSFMILVPLARPPRARADHATWPVSLKRHRMALLGHFGNRCPLGYLDSEDAICDIRAALGSQSISDHGNLPSESTYIPVHPGVGATQLTISKSLRGPPSSCAARQPPAFEQLEYC